MKKDGFTYICDVGIDAADFESGTKRGYDVTLALPSNMQAGRYDVYMRMSNSVQNEFVSAQSGIQFANKAEIYDAVLGANKLGSVTVSAADKSSCIGSDIFCEKGDGCVSGGLTTEGVPFLGGYGEQNGGSMTLTAAAGEKLEISTLNKIANESSLSFKWYKDGKELSDGKKLTVENVGKTDAGAYNAVITYKGKTYTTASVTVKVEEHSFSEYTVINKATCTSSGSAQRACSDCGAKETKVLKPLEHEIVYGTEEPTCTADGAHTGTCGLCGALVSFESIKMKPHNDDITVDEATCTVNGRTTYVCRDCGRKKVEPIYPLGHDFRHIFDGKTVYSVCSRCAENEEPNVIDTAEPSGAKITDASKVLERTTKLVVVGEGGLVPSYSANGLSDNITLLFRISGVKTPITLGKMRVRSRLDGSNSVYDSNDSKGYTGTLTWKIESDGVYAFTLAKNSVCSYDKAHFASLDYLAFFDPSAAGKNNGGVNRNEGAKFELLGIYDDILAYDVIYTDLDGKMAFYGSGSYNEQSVSANKLSKVLTAEELYESVAPEKRAEKDKVYTFSHWADNDGKRVDFIYKNEVLSPVFTAGENTCAHRSTVKAVIKEATCTEGGLRADVCSDCGAVMGGTEAISVHGHGDKIIRVTAQPTFKLAGEREIYCADCLTLISRESVAKISNPFGDVKNSAWYADAVSYVYSRGIFNGMSKNAFGPDTGVTRAMFVTVLGRMVNADVSGYKTSVFTDVPKGKYYTGYVAWANENGIVTGMSATTFAPDSPITREQMCTMIVRFADACTIVLRSSPQACDSFADITSVSKWALDSVENCRKACIVSGKSKTALGQPVFDPKSGATRAEVATILRNIHSNFMK